MIDTKLYAKQETLRIGAAIMIVAGLFVAGGIFESIKKGDRITFAPVKEVYAISHGNSFQGPRFKEVVIEPRKVFTGTSQQLSAVMEKPEEVVSVSAITKLDSSISTLVLSQNEDGAWSGEWVVTDTSVKTYYTTFIAKDKNGKSSQFTLAWSDPCSGVSLGGNGTLTASCSVSGVDGVDNGAFSLNGFTLTINPGAIFAWNPGFGVTVNGTIAVGAGGQLQQTYLWLRDKDNDGYSSLATPGQLAQDTQPVDYQRRFNRINTTDCYDANSNVFPGQAAYFSVPRGDVSFDYNCNSSEELQNGSLTSCITTCTGWDPESGACVTSVQTSTAGTWVFSSTFVCDAWDPESGTCISGHTVSAGSVPPCGGTGNLFTNTSCGQVSSPQSCR